MLNQEQITAIKELIDKYRSITIEFVKSIRNQESEYWQRKDPLAPSEILDMIAPLCESANGCKTCILYKRGTHCPQHITYKRIRDARSDEELLVAIKARADFLEEKLNHE